MTGLEPYILALTLTAETAVGSGSYSPYYLVSNRHGVMDERANTAYTRACLEWKKKTHDWQLEAALDLTASAHAYHNVYLQQCYASATWRWLTMSLGSREETSMLRDFRLSSGSMAWSGNSRPIPQAKLGLNGFTDIPGLGGWLQVYLDGSYGHFLDDDYLEKEYAQYIADKTGYGRSWITTDVWFHQKKALFRTKPTLPFVFTLGIEDVVQFGGHTRNYIDPTLTDAKFNPSFGDFMRALIPVAGGSNSAGGDQSFIYGNHLGDINVLLEYQWGKDRQYRIGAYLEDPFEDGTGIRKGNGWDGLWGLEFHNQDQNAWLTGLVVEHLRTADQSGPIHWAPHDFAGQEVVTWMPGEATGADDYYNHYLYTGYSHFGMACGNPMLKSPAFNDDHYLRFVHTRVQAWHLGVEGCLFPDRLTYRILASTRRAWGTYMEPARDLERATNALVELTYHQPRWSVGASWAMDHGKLYGNNMALGLRFTYHVF